MDIGWPEILIIAVVILVLFGSKKLPDAARSLGRSMRILKTEVKGMHDEDAPGATTPAAAQPPAIQQPGALQPPAPLPPAGTPAAAPAPAPTLGDRTDTP
jgi:sec-independent protein translocase protein TatA